VATTLPYFKPRTQKWLAVLGIAGISCLPVLIVHCVFDLSLLSTLLLQAAIFLITFLKNIDQYKLTQLPYDKTIESSKENPLLAKATLHFKKVIAKLSKKATLKEPELIFTQSDSNDFSPASTATKGATDYIGLNVQVLDWFLDKSPPQITESILAHEITHIVNQDYLTDLMLTFLNNTFIFQKNILYALTLCSLVVLPFIGLGLLISGTSVELFLLTLPISGGLIICAAALKLLKHISEFVNGTYNRAVEYLADEGAIKLTDDPLSAALMGYEIKYEVLNRIKRELTDNDPIKLPITALVNDIEALSCKKGLSKGLIYQQACKWLKNDNLRLPLSLNKKEDTHTHPSTKRRFKAIKLSHPEAIKKMPTLEKSDFYPQTPR
jgi:hypothetical protein